MALRQATIEKLEDLIGVTDLTVSEIKFICKNAPNHDSDSKIAKLERSVIASIKSSEQIFPAAAQIAVLEFSEKAAKAFGATLHPDTQEVICSTYPDDIPVLIQHAVDFKKIHIRLWQVLASNLKKGSLKAAVLKKLVARKDCPTQFLKAAGVTGDDAIKAQRKERATRSTAPKTVKAVTQDDDDDFEDRPRVSRAAKSVKR